MKPIEMIVRCYDTRRLHLSWVRLDYLQTQTSTQLKPLSPSEILKQTLDKLKHPFNETSSTKLLQKFHFESF
jgi:hypothetical protein